MTKSPMKIAIGKIALGMFGLASIGVALTASATPAQAQGRNVACTDPGQPLLRIPEIVSSGGRLRGVMTLTTEAARMNLGATGNGCVNQYIRAYRAPHGVLPGYQGTIPAGYPGAVPATPAPASGISDPMPGPTLRARVGDIIQLTFLNQIDTGPFGDSIDRAERGMGCDESIAPYPAVDTFPDCFHGSSTGNIHFHGTHTTPSTTGDNIFIEIRPSLRQNGKPVTTEASVKKSFDEFFNACEKALRVSKISQWPNKWSDLPKSWRLLQLAQLKKYDSDPANREKLLPTDLMQIAEGAWPQYYIGSYPYCFQLPAYTEATWPPAAPMVPSAHGAHAGHGGAAAPQERPLVMGQSPGTHWYHAHKHGSTTINVSNGMTGAFIIEGKYDDDLNAYYGAGWTRTQPILEINELGVSPNLFIGQAVGALPFQVNGRPQPTVSMQSGEVQMWRIVNSASRSGAFFVGPPQGFEWKQLAQDGVQFSPANYQNSSNSSFLMTAGNRVDLLVKAPVNTGTTPISVSVIVRQAINGAQARDPAPAKQLTLLTVMVQPGPAVTGNRATFVPQAQAPTLPPFLTDIKASEVKGTKKIVFESLPPTTKPPAGAAPFTQHYIDGKKFDGNIGEIVLLNTVEEWTIENRTVAPPISHPFHIHINPFQVTEVFDPLERFPDPADPTKQIDRYVIAGTTPPVTGQCVLDPNNQATWVPCMKGPQSDLIWWDVFAIPAGRKPAGTNVVIPGYFKMRSRFVDYTGQYVIHCHILAHEDRGMMTVVSVAPFRTPYSHQ